MRRFRVLLTILFALVFVAAATACGQISEPEPTHLTSESGTSASPSATDVDETESDEATEEPGETQEPEGPVSPVTGLPGTTDEYRPLVAQIENSPPARPQAGLQWADVVYETLMEGNDTRFTCVFNDILYSDESPEELEVGPIRSTRYYHQWIQGPWDGLYIHMGGAETPGRDSYIWGESSEHVQQRINGAGKYPSNAELEYRRKGTGKALEHTAYTELHADEEIMNYTPSQYQIFTYEPAESYEDEPQIEKVNLSFWAGNDFVEYRYDEDSDKLIRYMGGEEFLAEETGQPVEVQNLVIQYTDVSEFPNDGGRKRVEMFGEGEAEFYIHGRYIKGTWERKEGAHTPTVYKDENGDEIIFAPGNTWIAVHPNNREVITTFADGTTHVQNERADLHQ